MAIHQGLSKEKFIYSSFELRCAGVCWGKTFSFLTQIRPPGLYDYEAGGFRWWGPHLGDIAWWSCVVGIHTLWEKVLMRDCLQFDSSQKVFETFVGFPGNEPWIVGGGGKVRNIRAELRIHTGRSGSGSDHWMGSWQERDSLYSFGSWKNIYKYGSIFQVHCSFVSLTSVLNSLAL